ncbi:hypothetical protein BSLG_006026 [Batrachochytrium salamandrivorans]|nr:hypothetical protein BSLG_006026 [Batrachochytrium salamandrivorans]
MALALYHKGIINLKLGRVAEAVVDLTKIIGYVKPPLNFIATPGLMVPWDLHICEVLFNLALALFIWSNWITRGQCSKLLCTIFKLSLNKMQLPVQL